MAAVAAVAAAMARQVCISSAPFHEAARAARDAERARSRSHIDELREASDKARKDLARATKAGAKRCAGMLASKDKALEARAA